MSALFFVDRVSGGIATLLWRDGGTEGSFELPAGMLPPGTNGGEMYRADFTRDEEAEDEMRREIDALMDELGNNP